MHRTMKKAWAFILTLCLLLSVIPMGAQAALLQGEDYITQQLSLGEDLVLHLRASLPEKYEDLAKDATGTLTYAGNTKTYTMSDLTPDENGMYDMSVEMAVAEMTEDIHAVINAKVLGVNQEIINEHYSIRDYLVAIIEGDYSQTTKDLCLELLNMGAWAQLYFNHNISNLANAGYDIQPGYSVPDETPSVIAEGNVAGIKFYGTSVRFLSQTAVRFYFEADSVDGYTFTIGDTAYEPVAKEEGLYYIETPGINPQNMSDEINVSVTDGNKTLSVAYAPIWYFIRTYNKTEDEYSKALMEAAYSYYKTAESYKTQICMDVEISTLSGDFESVGLGFYPLNFEGDINNYTDRIEIPTNTTYTVKLDQGKYLVDGEFLGIGVTVLGGPTWDATLPDGSSDRHNIQISGLRLEGPEDRPIDLTFATIASGTNGTGYTNANAGGTAAVADGVISITNGFFTDGYKITFNEVDTYLTLDMEITTLSNSTDTLEVGFYPYGFDGSYSDEYTDKLILTAGTTNTVYLDAAKYLVDGEIPGIGFVIFGGPEWNTELSDGTYDRHNITVSNICLEGEQELTFDLSRASVQTGFAGSNSGGIATVADGIVSVVNGFRYDGHMITFVDESIPEETEPEVTEPEVTEPEVTEPEVTEPEVTEPEETEPPATEPDTYLCVDMLFTTLGNSTDPVDIGFYPYNFEGDINNHTDKIAITAGTKTTVKLDAAKYMVDGNLTGLGFAIFGGPAWDAKLEDGYTPDRHTITISAVYLEGEQNTAYDLSKSVWANGNNGTGFTNANGSGAATIGSEIVITNGFQYDGHKISLVEDTNTYITMDMQIDTLGGDWANDIEIRFYNYDFQGNPHDIYTDSVIFKAGEKQTVKLKADQYLVDGKLTGIGIGIFGGPAWDAKLPDGYTPDRHTVTISNVKLEGEEITVYDLNMSTCISGTGDTGYTAGNGNGKAAIGESIVISDGFCYDVHKISLTEDTRSFVTMDMQIDTLGGDWANDIEIRFYNYGFEGNPHEIYTDRVIFKAGQKQTVKLDADKYLVDGELTGIGIGIFGGPAWDAKLPDGYTPDRHTVTISNVKLEGTQSKAFNLNKSTVTSGTGDTGYTSGNGNGKAAIGEAIVISDGFCYDVHKISLVEDTRSFITMDMLFTTLGGSTAPVEIGFYPSNFEGDINNWTDKLTITAGTTANIRLDAEKYMVDGQVSGIGFAIFGGPAWDAKLPDGYTPDRHTLTISNARLEGAQSMAFDLSQSTWANGQNGTGYTNANGSGAATMGQSIVITNGFQYDGHKISLVEDTSTYIEMDLLLTTLGNSTDPVEVRFCKFGQTDSVHTTYTNMVQITAGTKTTVRFKVDEYLVDGQLPGFGIAIFGGPQWNTQLEDGTYDRHSVVISNLRLTGVDARDIDLSTATVTVGIPGSNTGGQIAIVDGEIVITGGFCYDGHLITF